MNTKEVTEKYYEYVNSGDWNNWLSLFDDRVVMDEQLAGHIEGIEVLRSAVETLENGYSKFFMYPQNVLVSEEESCVIWHCVAANADGVPIDAKGANYFRVENSKIVYMSNFHDTRPFDPFVNQKSDEE